MSTEGGIQLLNRKNTDWMRGMAAIFVVISHYAEWWSWFTPSEGNVELFRIAMMKVGDYAVAVFLVLSGYALVRSLKGQAVTLSFVGRRIRNVYLPYFVVMGIIEILSGGFTSAQDFLMFASGYDHWYMFILFVFYLGFFVIWRAIPVRSLRVGIMAVFVGGFSWFMYTKGMQDFWYTANVSFAIGILLGEYEAAAKRMVDKTAIFGILLCSVAMFFVIRSGLWPDEAAAAEEGFLWLKVGAVVVWTLLTIYIAAGIKVYEPILPLLGRASLYIYLTHQFIFMWVVNHMEESFAVRFGIAAVSTVAVSLFFYLLLSKGVKYILSLILRGKRSSLAEEKVV